MNSSEQNLAVNFFLAYRCLLKALAKNDRNTLADICEGTLYRRLSDSLDLVKDRNLRLKLINKEKHKMRTDSFNGSLNVVDF